ncbi:MAG TPA: hypothetical protein VFJ74_17635 [Gemmatimonadaceae bacterium]|nr:hypothetical protein [Gemmatimonadaceae bacterium]
MSSATRRARRASAAACLALALLSPSPASGQRSVDAATGLRADGGAARPAPNAAGGNAASIGRVSLPASADDDRSRVLRARWAPVASAALPGAGQALLDQDRFLPYLALEAYAWLKYVSDSREGSRQRAEYRRLARTVARSQFSSNPPNGNWEYYERMEHYVESGVYDVVPGGALEPEPDTTTFNGSVWLLARETYWEDPSVAPDPASPAYASAIAFYRQRAVSANYRWSWRDAQLEQDLFRRTIARSNDFYRRAAEDLGVVIANHVLSTVDSYVTVRLRSRRGGRLVGPGGVPGDGADGYDLSVRLPLPGR